MLVRASAGDNSITAVSRTMMKVSWDPSCHGLSPPEKPPSCGAQNLLHKSAHHTPGGEIPHKGAVPQHLRLESIFWGANFRGLEAVDWDSFLSLEVFGSVGLAPIGVVLSCMSKSV